MKQISKLLKLVILTTVGITVFTSCWKDKTLLDRENQYPNLDITPSYGLPLCTYDVTCENLLNYLNEEYLDKTFDVEFKAEEDYLGYFIYNQTTANCTIDYTENPLHVSGDFPMIEVISNDTFIVHQAQIRGYATNYSNNSLYLDNALLYYLNSNGDRKDISITLAEPYIPNQPRATHVFDAVANEPMDLLGYGNTVYYDFQGHLDGGTDTSGSMDITPEIHVPAWITLYNCTANDTVYLDEVDLENILSYNDSIADGKIRITGLSLRTSFINYFPFAATVTCMLMDSNMNDLGLLIDHPVTLDAGVTNASYKVVTPAEKRVQIDMKEGDQLYENLKKTRYLKLIENYSSYNHKDVKLFKENYLRIKLSVAFQTDVKGNLNDIIESF